MTILRRLLAGAIFTLIALSLASSFELVPLSRETFQILDGLFLALWGIFLVVDWRCQKRRTAKEPSPASSAVGVIVATGGFAVVTTARSATSAADYAVPIILVVATMLLAFVAYRFATKNRDAIGEARFKTMPGDN